MNEPLDQSDPLTGIEQRLHQLEPAAAPAELMNRLAAIPSHPSRVVDHPWRWLALAAAACIVLATAWTLKEKRTPQLATAAREGASPNSLRVYAPVSSRNFLLDAREIGLIVPENSPPVRLVRCLWLDNSTYRADDGSSDLQVSGAREQIIPVALEIY